MSKKRKIEEPYLGESPLEEKKSDSCKSDPSKVGLKDNHIYFYSEVSRNSILELNKNIRELNKSLIEVSMQYDIDPPKIYIHINSLGGGIFQAFSAVDAIRSSKIPVVTIIEGCAASAATLISISGHERCITPNSYMLIHELSGLCWGKYSDMKDECKNLDLFMNKIKDMYIQHTKIPSAELDNILKRDIWWDANQCFAYGLVDEVRT